MDGGFATRLVSGVTGLSMRQLDYYDRTGLVIPEVHKATGSGSRRSYSFQNIVELKTVARLRSYLSLQRIRKSLDFLRAHFPETDRPLASLKFLTDGINIFVLTEDSRVLLDTLNQGQLVIAIAVGQFIEETRSWTRSIREHSSEQIIVEGEPYTIDIVPADGESGFVVTCRELKGAISQGETLDEAREMIADAITLVRQVLREHPRAAARKAHGR